MLANQMLTDVRQRVQHEQQGRRGMKVDPAWAHRRLLLRAGNQLSPKALDRLGTIFESAAPANQTIHRLGHCHLCFRPVCLVLLRHLFEVPDPLPLRGPSPIC